MVSYIIGAFLFCFVQTTCGQVIGFTAISTETNTYEPGDVVQFPVALQNFGNAFDPSSGVFTCPEDGVYVFHVSISVGDMENLTTLKGQLVHQGGVVVSASTYTRGTFTETGSNMALVDCASGDEVFVQVGPDGGTLTSTNDGDSAFTGYRLG